MRTANNGPDLLRLKEHIGNTQITAMGKGDVDQEMDTTEHSHIT